MMTGSAESAARPGDIWARLRDVMTANTVVGAPIVSGDTTIVPVVRSSGASCRCHGCGCGSTGGSIGGGSTAGSDSGSTAGADAAEGSGARGHCAEGPESGGGAGVVMRSKPVGVFVINGEKVTWQPVFDLNKVILGGQIIGFATILVIGAVLRSHLRRRPGCRPGCQPGGKVPSALITRSQALRR